MRPAPVVTAICSILLAAVFTGTALGKGADPRKCATNTPGGTAHHAYWCAHKAAIDAVRTNMAASQHVTRWFAPTFCNQAATVLRWTCSTTMGGQVWKGTVTFKATANGWRTVTNLTLQP